VDPPGHFKAARGRAQPRPLYGPRFNLGVYHGPIWGGKEVFMTSEKPESSGFLALIDAKIAALQQLRESLILAFSTGALGQASDIDFSQLAPSGAGTPSGGGAPPAGSRGPIELPTGLFRGQGLSDAIRLYLEMAKRKQTNTEIKNALMEGGLATTSDFFDQTLSSTLHRMRKKGELLHFKDGWDLAVSYPDSFRQRMIDAKEPVVKNGSVKKKRRRRKAKIAAKGATKTKVAPVKADAKVEAAA
jgi:hypothetical protein